MELSQKEEELYLHTPNGGSILVEMFTTEKTMNIVFGDRRIDLYKSSAYELADAILLTLASDRTTL